MSGGNLSLDTETVEALGFGDAWEQLAIRWPLYVVARTETPAERKFRQRNRREHDARYRANHRPVAAVETPAYLVRGRREDGRFVPTHATEAERLEAKRARTREAMRRVRARRKAAA